MTKQDVHHSLKRGNKRNEGEDVHEFFFRKNSTIYDYLGHELIISYKITMSCFGIDCKLASWNIKYMQVQPFH